MTGDRQYWRISERSEIDSVAQKQNRTLMFLQRSRILPAVNKPRFQFNRRASGLLMHPTSLPGPHGSGDIGGEARKFADFLAAAGQTWWQMLPVGPAGAPPGNSPYSSSSSFAGNPYLIDLSALVEENLLTRDDIEPTLQIARSAAAVNFDPMIAFREQRLRRAFERFDQLRCAARGVWHFLARDQNVWLDDYSLFAALKTHYLGTEWTRWERGVRLRDPGALKSARQELTGEIRYQKFAQYLFDRQWNSLRKYCNDRGVALVGDIPIFRRLGDKQR